MTAPPAVALEACLALLEDLRKDNAAPRFAGCLEIRCANFLRQHGPALLAALRLREWVPVSERLPERDGLGAVLAFDADRSRKGVWLETSHPTWWGKYNDAAGEWMPSITHWMPLPAPPPADDLARVLEEGE